MKEELMNLFLFIGISLVLYILFRNFKYNSQYSLIEGLTTDTSGNNVIPSGNGIAGNAVSYSSQIKAATIKLQDTFLFSKYSSDYETVIVNLDDFINNLMLKNVLSFDMENPGASLSKLVELQQAKVALNGVMKFVDAQ
jgi:hypothetical protein